MKVTCQYQAPVALPPGKNSYTHLIADWVGFTAVRVVLEERQTTCP